MALYAFWSNEAVDVCGTVVYTTPEGGVVTACFIARDKEATGYMWPDTVLLGEVKQFVERTSWGIFGRMDYYGTYKVRHYKRYPEECYRCFEKHIPPDRYAGKFKPFFPGVKRRELRYYS